MPLTALNTVGGVVHPKYSFYYRKPKPRAYRGATVHLIDLVVSVPNKRYLISRYPDTGIGNRYTYTSFSVTLAYLLGHSDALVLSGIVYGVVDKIVYHL